MATARETEADAASTAFHAAMLQIGVETVAEALALWEQLPPESRPEVAASWLRKAMNIVMGRRSQGRDLALAYYRLARALRTGKTIPDPRHPEPTYVTLGDLREQFQELAQSSSTGTPPRDTGSPQEGGTQSPGPEDNAPDAQEGDDLDRILIEELREIEAEERRLEEEAQAELREQLANLGALNQQKKLDALDKQRAADEIDAERARIHREVGARQAAAAARIAMNGARAEVWSLADKDPRCIGYVRVSRTGTPCGWCAMLISRGPVYRSESSATYKGAASYDDGDKYHDNCNCYAMPIFSKQQYNSSELFELNRKYSDLWPQVTLGLNGKAALSAWRNFIRRQTRAQVARPNTTAQEA